MEFDWWNTIQAHKNFLMFMQCNDWVCFDYTLDAVFMVDDGM